MTREEAIERAAKTVPPDRTRGSGRVISYRFQAAKLFTDHDYSDEVRAPYWSIVFGEVMLNSDGSMEWLDPEQTIQPFHSHSMVIAIDDRTGAMAALDIV